ncbi:MAG: universal stress protein [Deltaproteobacteria bacterium]|nr:universal stress protein [Deltaproteobacteria bacterium]
MAIKKIAESLLLNLEEQMQKEYGAKIGEHIKYDLVVLDGHVSTEILEYLKENQTDVVVMGSYGLSGMGLFEKVKIRSATTICRSCQ